MRQGFTAVVLCLLWSASARAAPSQTNMNPDPVDVGNVVIGSSGTAMGTLSDNNNDHVDLDVSSACLGSGTGTFTVSPNDNVDLTNPTVITVTYTPTTAGSLTCQVNVRMHGQMLAFDRFNVRGNGQNAATISVPAPANFGAVRFNDAAPTHTSSQNVTVTNTGGSTLNVSDVTIGGTNAGDWSITSGGTTGAILPNNSKTWGITFNPSAAGARAATLTFTSNDPATNMKTVSLAGTGSTGIIGTTDTLAFGIVNAGSSSALDDSVANNGSGTKGNLGVTVATIAGGAGWFTFNGCGGTGTCNFSPALAIANTAALVGIKCTPPATANVNDTQNATVTFTSDTDDAAATPDNVTTLTCTAGKSVLATNMAGVTFGSQLVTTTTNTTTITVTNNGNQPGTFWLRKTGNAANQAMYTVAAAGGCGTSAASTCPIAVGASVNVDVVFTPTVEGDVPAGLDIVTSGTFPQLSLVGRGIDRHISVAMSVDFPDTFKNPGSTATLVPVAVKNIGEYPLHVMGLVVAGSPVWELADSTTDFMVPGLGMHDVMMKFSPNIAGKATDGHLVVTSDDRTTAMSTITLTGNGKDRNVQMGPSTIDLGDTGAGVPTRLSEIRPDGLLEIVNLDDGSDFKIREIKLSGDAVFAIENVSGSSDLTRSTTNKYDIVFRPPTIGEFEATATLFLDEDGDPQTSIPIRGRALFVDAHGAGGCSAGGGGGLGSGLVVLVLGAFAARRRRRTALGGAVIASVLAVPTIAGADDPSSNISLTVFDPTPSTSGSTFQLQTTEVGKSGDLAVSMFASYASNPLVLGTVQGDDAVVRHHTMLSLGGAYAFGSRFEAGAHMPLYVQSGQTLEPGMFGVPPASGAARGDLQVHGKVQIVNDGNVHVAASLSVTLPTASDSQFTGTALPTVRLLGLASTKVGKQLSLLANLGPVLRKSVAFANIDQGSGLSWGAGASFRALDQMFIDAQIFGDLIPGGYLAEPPAGSMVGASSMLATVEALGGLRFQITRQISAGLAAGRGVTSAIGTPDLRGVFTFAFTPSATPLPTLHPITPDAPADPNKEDSDYDGIVDAQDKCPHEAEDKDKFQDEDGCPDLDDDQDGVPDDADKCRRVAEDKDGFEDDDGCPDPDNDKDGIADAKDKCPDQPERINGNADDDGCPDAGDSLVISNPDRLELLDAVTFSGTSVARTSANIMGQLAATLRGRADISRLRITVHVQPTKEPAKDQALTDKRAESLKIWLINWGIAEERIEVRGFGGTKPLVPPTQKGAAQINDRVELIILERK